jgi:Siphovirus Gp157
MPSLLEINADLVAFRQLLEETAEANAGEITPEAEQVLDEWFAALGQERDAKLDNYVALIRDYTLRAAARREEMERLAMRVKVDENQARRLKDRLKLFLELQGQKKIETARYRIAVAANGGKQAVEVLVPAGELSAIYQRLKVEVDTEALREALTAGKEVAGARLQPRGTHLRIS